MNINLKITLWNIIQIKKEFFFGIMRCSPKFNMAYPEKALLDIIYIRYKKGKMDKYILESFLSDLYLSELNEKNLLSMLKNET